MYVIKNPYWTISLENQVSLKIRQVNRDGTYHQLLNKYIVYTPQLEYRITYSVH